MNIFNRIFKPKDKPQNSLLGSAYSFFFGSSSSGKAVNERSAMQATVVYACVRIIAETIASLPLHTFKYSDSGKERATDHPLYRLLHDEPNPEMTSFAWRETLMTHLLLWGNSFSQIIRDGRGRVTGLYPLMPDRMKVDRDKNGKLFYEYHKDSGSVTLTPDDVLHVPGLGFDGILGYSPIAMAKNAIGMALAVEEFGSKFFANGAMPGVVLKHPSVVKDIKRLRESWNNLYEGSANAHKTAVLEEGMSAETIGIPPEAAQFLETRRFQVAEICRIFRVPPHLVADLDRATFSNIESQNINFVVHTIRPWLVRLESIFNKCLFPASEKGMYFTSFNVDGLLRGNYESRMKGYSIGIQNGFLSPNDVRELENMNPIPNGDVYAMNGNMCLLENIGAAYAKQQPQESP
jgi:HK97 family phage portal protein